MDSVDSKKSQEQNSSVPTVTGDKLSQIEKSLTDLSESPHFVPLMGSFRDMLESERKRHRDRMAVVIGIFVLVAVLFILGPLYLVKSFLAQAQGTLNDQRQSLQRVEQSINSSMSTLTLSLIHI